MIETGVLVDLSNIKPNLNQERQSLNERVIRGLSLRGGSPEDIARIVSASINSPRETMLLTDQEKEMVLARKFLSFFSDDLTDWNLMLSIVGDNSNQRSFPALLCLEAFLKARTRGHVGFYFSRFNKVFEKCPSPLTNEHRAIKNFFFPENHGNRISEDVLSADIHRFRRRGNEEMDVMEESPLDVDEGAFFE